MSKKNRQVVEPVQVQLQKVIEQTERLLKAFQDAQALVDGSGLVRDSLASSLSRHIDIISDIAATVECYTTTAKIVNDVLARRAAEAAQETPAV